MKFRIIIYLFLLLISSNIIYSQKTDRFKLKLKTGGDMSFDGMTYGFDVRATDSVDLALGENYDLPGPPPIIFQGFFQIYASDSTYSYLDLRPYPAHNSDTVKYRIELFNSISFIDISWDKFPDYITEAKLYDFYHEGFVEVNMKDSLSFHLNNPYFKLFEIQLKYDANFDNIELDKNNSNIIGKSNIFPNPVELSPLKIKSENPINKIEIISEVGNLISEINFSNPLFEFEYNFDALPSGVYLINIYYNSNSNSYSGEKETRKIIKK